MTRLFYLYEFNLNNLLLFASLLNSDILYRASILLRIWNFYNLLLLLSDCYHINCITLCSIAPQANGNAFVAIQRVSWRACIALRTEQTLLAPELGQVFVQLPVVVAIAEQFGPLRHCEYTEGINSACVLAWSVATPITHYIPLSVFCWWSASHKLSSRQQLFHFHSLAIMSSIA